MFIDIKKYRHYDQLKKLVAIHLEEYEIWKDKYNYEDRMQVTKYHHPEIYPEFANIKDDSDAYHRPENIPDRPNPNENWYCDAIHSVGHRGKQWDDWGRSADLTFNLPGCTQHIVNFIRPNTKLRDHDDFGGWVRNAKDMNVDQLNGFTVSLTLDGLKGEQGISMWNPFADILQTKTCGVGEWMVFEGKTHMHHVFNNSEHWRVTAIIDIEASHFDLEDHELDYLNNRWANYKRT